MTRIVLHPRYKLAYFRQQQWEDAWVQTAENITREAYKASYANINVAASSAPVDGAQEGDDGMNLDDEVRRKCYPLYLFH